MIELTGGAAQTLEAATVTALLNTARQRQRTAFEKSPATPRFLLEHAATMAAHLAMSESRMQNCLAPMALWQLYMPAAIGANTWDFAAVREHLPWSYERVHAALAVVESRAQVVSTIFHMAAFPLLCSVIGAAWRDLHAGPLHVLVASRNMGWLRHDNTRWSGDAVEVLSTSPSGLRQLMTGLKRGSIRRLLVLADGPQLPGAAGTRALAGVGPGLGISTLLLTRIHAFGIPLVPITHEWEEDRLLMTPQPVLDPATLDEAATMDAVVGHIEGLLHRHPEQWLNWHAARMRT